MRIAGSIAIMVCLALLAGCANDASLEPAPTREAPPAQAEPEAPDHVELSAEALAKANLQVAAADLRPATQVLRVPGRFTNNENRTWGVGAITAGRIVRTYANQGDPIREGDVLARMHSHEIHDARANYRNARAEVERLEAAEQYAQRLADRQQRLYELKAGSLAEWEQAQAELRDARGALERGRIEFERAQQHLEHFLKIRPEEPHEHAEGLAETDADLIPVLAPAAGTVLARNVSAGSVVEPSGGALFLVSDLSTLWMMAAVHESDLGKVRVGQPVSLQVQAYPEQRFTGRVSRIEARLDPETRTALVRVEVPNPGGRLKPEMFADAEIAVDASRPAIHLPAEAVQEYRGRSVVFVETAPYRFEARDVTLGRSDDGTLEIASGLQAGEKVVVRGGYLLKSHLMKAEMGEE